MVRLFKLELKKPLNERTWYYLNATLKGAKYILKYNNVAGSKLSTK